MARFVMNLQASLHREEAKSQPRLPGTDLGFGIHVQLNDRYSADGG
jgi:hypothetical protein